LPDDDEENRGDSRRRSPSGGGGRAFLTNSDGRNETPKYPSWNDRPIRTTHRTIIPSEGFARDPLVAALPAPPHGLEFGKDVAR